MKERNNHLNKAAMKEIKYRHGSKAAKKKKQRRGMKIENKRENNRGEENINKHGIENQASGISGDNVTSMKSENGGMAAAASVTNIEKIRNDGMANKSSKASNQAKSNQK